MSKMGAYIDCSETGGETAPCDYTPRVLITGACSEVGRVCAEVLSARGVDLILSDKDVSGLGAIAAEIGAASLFCDVASERSVASLADKVSEHFASLDMVINAAGGRYERSLGMYRVSRALLAALRRGNDGLILNIPPAPEYADTAIFPYASSRLAFQRLSSALALETRGTLVKVMIGSPMTGYVSQVQPDPNAGTWVEACNVEQPNRENMLAFAHRVASLVGPHTISARHAG